MSNGNNPNDPPQELPQRTVEMEIDIVVSGKGFSKRRFKLYEGTEMVYAQAVDLAVAKVLGEISKAAFDIISSVADQAPENIALEAQFGAAVQENT